MKPLLDAGANVNARDVRGCTALHRACYFGRYECLKELVRWADVDVDWDARTPDEKNALDLVQVGMRMGYVDVHELQDFEAILQPRVHAVDELEDMAMKMPGAFPMCSSK